MNTNYNKFIDFFKKYNLYNEEVFNYIKQQTIIFSIYNEELMNVRGICYNYNKLEQLTSFTLYVPYINNEKTAFMNIRPYVQAICAYPKLGKKYKTAADIEIIAFYFERLYLQDNPNQELEEYLNKIYTRIRDEETETNYKIALNAQPMLEEYAKVTNPNFKKIQNKAKKLSKKRY